MKFEPATTVAVAIHLQNDIVGVEGGLTAMFREQIVARGVLAKARYVLGASREAGVGVVYTRVAFAPDYSDMRANSPLLAGTVAADCLKDGTPGAEIAPEVAPQPGDAVIAHTRIGGFAESPLDDVLRARGAQTLLVFGVATNVSVETTARWAGDLGYEVVLVEDACAAGTAAAHEASVASLGMMGHVASSDEVVSALRGCR